MAKLVLCHVAKLSKIKQMWHLQMICSKFAIEVNPFFRPVQGGPPGSKLIQRNEQIIYIHQGPVPKRPSSVNPGLKFCSVFVFYIPTRV